MSENDLHTDILYPLISAIGVASLYVHVHLWGAHTLRTSIETRSQTGTCIFTITVQV